jgi:hypothetical protein
MADLLLSGVAADASWTRATFCNNDIPRNVRLPQPQSSALP